MHKNGFWELPFASESVLAGANTGCLRICKNANEIYKSVRYILKNPNIAKKQLEVCNKTLDGIRSKSSSSSEVASILRNNLII